MRFLGIDFGEKKVGIAIGDDSARIASPLHSISAENIFDELAHLIQKESIDAFVVGIPKKVGAFHSKDQLQKTKSFIEELRNRFNKDVFEEDERYTSVESQRLQEQKGTHTDEDALAAMLILQAFLNEEEP